ncbi:MAG TPA: hypothetical protein VKR42_01665, partial [Ktedonobacteraceae bacterium]|nr:hypothetical protein [Ktedonobacteraceae bacterium]
RLHIALDSKQRRALDAIQVTICNAPYYGAHLEVASGALMDDGWLDIVMYRHFSKLEYLRHAFSISQGRRIYQPKIRRRRARTLTIIADVPMAIQADGVGYGHTPATIQVLPGALRVRVSAIETIPAIVTPENERKALTNAR